MRLDFGTEKRFSEFVLNLKKDKTALISHTDLDGIASAVVANKIIQTDNLYFVNYTDLNNKLIQKLKEDKIKRVIFTDLYLKDEDFVKELEKACEVLIIDHHPAAKDWNSDKTVFIKGEDGYSCGFLCYHLFGKIKDIDVLDWLVACSCVSDYCHEKPADWLKKVFEKYHDKLEFKDNYVRKSGKIWDLQWKISLGLIYFSSDLKKVYENIGDNFGEIGELEKSSQGVQKEIDFFVNKFEKEKKPIEDGYFFEFAPKFKTGSIVTSVISGKYPNKTIITIRHSENGESIGMRRQDGKINSGNIISNLLLGLKESLGGGHLKAAGGHFLAKDLPEVKKRLGLKE